MRPYQFISGPWENSELPTIVKDDPAGGDPHRNHVEARASRTPARQYVSETHDHKPDADAQIHAGIVTTLSGVASRRRIARAQAVAEIERNGTYWAACEITRLREDLARARRELRNQSNGGSA